VGDEARASIKKYMLDALVVILIVLWLLGFFAFSLGSFVHILLILAVIAIVFRLVGGRRSNAL